MSGIPKREIAAFVAQCVLERDQINIVVEGRTDADLVRWYVEAQSNTAGVHCVEMFYVPGDLLASHGLTSGNRQRVLAMAKAVEGKVASDRALFIVDRDLDDWTGSQGVTSNLIVRTEYCSLDMCLFHDQTLHKFLRLSLASEVVANPTTFWRGVRDIARALFALRVVLSRRDLRFTLISLDKYFALDGDSMPVLEFERYVCNVAINNAKGPMGAQLLEEARALERDFPDDCRRCANAHDLLETLAWWCSRLNQSWLRRPEHLMRVLRSCSEVDCLKPHEPFVSIDRICG